MGLRLVWVTSIVALAGGCSKTIGSVGWGTMRLFSCRQQYDEKIDWTLAQTGDILVQECDGGLLGWFGHCGIIVSEDAVAEVPKIGTVVYCRRLDDWKTERRVALLRLKGIDDAFVGVLLDQVRKSLGKPYLILPKKLQWGFTCSSFVWNAFYRAGKRLERPIDLDSNRGLLVMPWDFVGDDDLWIVDVMGRQTEH